MLSDEELARDLGLGQAAALEALVRRYHEPLLGYLFRLLRDRSVAEDLVQETLIHLCRGARQYRYPSSFRPWLYGIATNLCRDYWKSAHHRHSLATLTFDAPEALVPATDLRSRVEDLAAWQETRAEVEAAVSALPGAYREVLVLRFYQDLSIKEIAETLLLPEGTVKWRLFESLRKLRKNLEGLAMDGGLPAGERKSRTGRGPTR